MWKTSVTRLACIPSCAWCKQTAMSWPLSSFIFLAHFPYILPYHLGCFSNALFPCLDNLVYHCAFTSRWSAKSRFEIRHCVIISVALSSHVVITSVFFQTRCFGGCPAAVVVLRRESVHCNDQVTSKASKVESLGERLPLCPSFPCTDPLLVYLVVPRAIWYWLISSPLLCFLAGALEPRHGPVGEIGDHWVTAAVLLCALHVPGAETGASSMVSWMFALICFGSTIPVGGRELSK